MRRVGIAVRIVVVTDGAASHRASATWPKPRLVAERRRETLRAAATMGVARDHVRFLGFPDGGLDSLSRADRAALVRRLARGPQPDLVVQPHGRDAHPDHRDVARACALAWPVRVPRLAYTVWSTGAATGRPSSHLALPARVARKRAVLRLYRTQVGLVTDDPDGFALTQAQIRAMCGPFERYDGEAGRSARRAG